MSNTLGTLDDFREFLQTPEAKKAIAQAGYIFDVGEFNKLIDQLKTQGEGNNKNEKPNDTSDAQTTGQEN